MFKLKKKLMRAANVGAKQGDYMYYKHMFYAALISSPFFITWSLDMLNAKG